MTRSPLDSDAENTRFNNNSCQNAQAIKFKSSGNPALETVQKTHHPWSHSHYCPNSPTLLAFQTNTPCLQKYPIMTVINLQTLA